MQTWVTPLGRMRVLHRRRGARGRAARQARWLVQISEDKVQTGRLQLTQRAYSNRAPAKRLRRHHQRQGRRTLAMLSHPPPTCHRNRSEPQPLWMVLPLRSLSEMPMPLPCLPQHSPRTGISTSTEVQSQRSHRSTTTIPQFAPSRLTQFGALATIRVRRHLDLDQRQSAVPIC